MHSASVNKNAKIFFILLPPYIERATVLLRPRHIESIKIVAFFDGGFNFFD